jgi:hypothetical protein
MIYCAVFNGKVGLLFLFFSRRSDAMKHVKMIGLGLVVAAIAVGGCSPKKNDTKPAANGPANAESAGGTADHAPHGTGPNGGVVFDLGKHHAEFTVDHDKKECTILVLGSDEKTPTPVTAEELTLNIKESQTADGTPVPAMTVTMKPVDAKDGKASKFVGTDEGLGNVADFEGAVVGDVEGKPSQGEFKE